ncbi:redoxin [Sphingobacterium sp. JUb78]|nr:redoxin [Sphingobacterium sp. JUb78]
MNMKKLKLFLLSFFLFIMTSTLYAQAGKNIDLSKALKVGDTFIPPNEIQKMRGTGNVIDLDATENKVIILDFFDTFCGTCIQSMPKLQQLQDKLKSKLQIINIAWQDKEILDKFFANNAFLKENKVNLPVIYSDSYLKELFPHQSAPHVVFLYKGKVQAITGNKLVTEDNVLALINNGRIDLPLKDDFGKVNLLGQAKNEMQIKGMVMLSGYQNGVPFESFKNQRDSVSGLQKISFYNVSIYSAVLSSWAKIKMPNYIPRPERLILKVKNPDRYEDLSNLGDIWEVQNAISYERLDPVLRSDSAQAHIVLNDLYSFLGIRTYRTMKNIESLILKPCEIKPYLRQPGAKVMNYDNSSVLAVMTDMSGKYPPVLDMVKSNEKIILEKYSNLEELNDQLANYGIKAEIGIGEQEVLVIEEIK